MSSFSRFFSRNNRYLIEFVLIFLSVVLAFYFEDYRSKREEKNNYLTALKNFRHDLYREFLIVDSGINTKQEGRLFRHDSIFKLIKTTEDPFQRLVLFDEIPMNLRTNIIQESEWYSKLSDYPFRIEGDELTWMMKTYERNKYQRSEMYLLFDSYISRFWENNIAVLDKVNLENPINENFGRSIELSNTIDISHELLGYIISFDKTHHGLLNQEIQNIDRLLSQNGMEISDFETDHLQYD